MTAQSTDWSRIQGRKQPCVQCDVVVVAGKDGWEDLATYEAHECQPREPVEAPQREAEDVPVRAAAGSLSDELARELGRLRVHEEARQQLAAERRGAIVLPEMLTLRERLARPFAPVRYRINGWQPAGSSVLLAAQYKAGKTTAVGNLIRSLVDGEPWLGVADVEPVTGTVVLLDLEMSQGHLDEWLRDQGIRKDDKVVVLSLKGRASSFDILDGEVRAVWATALRALEAEYVIVDCLRPILDALGLDESHDAGRWFVAFDALLTEALIPDACVVHHMGHGQERSRGDSRIRDWPAAEWRLVRATDEPNSTRFISAYGRDVEVAETALHYDRSSRHLTLAEGSRRDAAAMEALVAVQNVLREAAKPMSGRAVEGAMKGTGHTRTAVRGALEFGVKKGDLTSSTGRWRSILYECASAP